MKSLMKEMKDKRIFVALFITFGFITLTFAVFPSAFARLGEALKNVVVSFGYFFVELAKSFFNFDYSIFPSVTVMPEVPESGIPLLPNGVDIFQIKLSMWGNALISGNNIELFFYKILRVLRILAPLAVFLVLIGVVIYALIRKYLKTENNDYGEDTKPLKVWKKLSASVFQPLKHSFFHFIDYVKEHGLFWKLWLAIWAFNFNFFAIALDALAFALYFVFSWDFGNIYVQVCKLLIDLTAMLNFVPLWCWFPVGIGIFQFLRTKRGIKILILHEIKNRGFLRSMPLVLSIFGLMGMGKTKFMTDLAISQEVEFRNTAFEHLLKCDLKFPFFPWIVLELYLRDAMEEGEIFNLASCRKWIRSRRAVFSENPSRETCFGYDYETYGETYNDNLNVVHLFDVLETYAQLYVIYVMDTGLIVSNYSIRLDDFKIDNGNFPLYQEDFFKRSPEMQAAYSRHSHILDYDILRLGKKVIENNPLGGSFEMGGVIITEIDKERQNSPSLSDVKKDSDTANQKNDLFGYSLMLARHPATVDFIPFVRFLMDAQRTGSVGANVRELSVSLTVTGSSYEKYTLGLFWLETWFGEWILGKLNNFYVNRRFLRGDHTLAVHLVNAVRSKLGHYLEKNKNTYGYSKLSVEAELGSLDGKTKDYEYYLQNKKIYSNRYSTDAYGDYFAVNALKSGVGILNYPEFENTKATLEEFMKENSYMFNDITGRSEKQKEKEKKKPKGANAAD